MGETSKPERRADAWARIWLIGCALIVGLASLFAFAATDNLLGAACVVASCLCLWAGALASPRVRKGVVWFLF